MARIEHELEQLTREATFSVDSFDEETRTVDLVATTGARVLRFPFWDEPFEEELEISARAFSGERLRKGVVPLLNSHRSFELENVIGAIRSYRMEEGAIIVSAQFSSRDSVADIVRDVKEGILGPVSIGYWVRKFKDVTPEDAKKGDPKRLRAVKWDLHEVSLVPVGADPDAKARSAERPRTLCIFDGVGLPLRAERQEETQVPDEPKVTAETPPAAETPAAGHTPEELARAQTAERERIQGIRAIASEFGLPRKIEDELCDDPEKTEADAQKAALRHLKGQQDAAAAAVTSHVEVTADRSDNFVKHAAEAIRFRVGDVSSDEMKVGKELRSFSLLELARESLRLRGQPIPATRMELAQRALGGAHGTTDFPLILADVAHKSMLAEYGASPRTYRALCRRGTASDFRTMHRLRLGEGANLVQVSEHGEYVAGSFGESDETYAVQRYGRWVALTLEAMVNDSLDAFSQMPRAFGRAAGRLENSLFWGLWTNNNVMGDGTALFDAGHANYAAAAGAAAGGPLNPADLTSLSAARKAMRIQTGIDGNATLNIMSRFLVVPASLETTAQQILRPISPAAAEDVNPFSGTMQAIVEPLLDANSLVAWYLAANPVGGWEVGEYAYLDGEEGPNLNSEADFTTDGFRLRVRHIFGAKMLDWRGVYKAKGAA